MPYDSLNANTQPKIFLKKEHSFYIQQQNTWKSRLLLSSAGATFTYKYETRIIDASNFYYSPKEMALSPERPGPKEWQLWFKASVTMNQILEVLKCILIVL